MRSACHPTIPYIVSLLAVASLVGCGVKVNTKREGFPCNPDGSCASGLVCSGGTCVSPAHLHADGGAGDGGAGDGGAGDGGTRDGGAGDGGAGDGGVSDGGAACVPSGPSACAGCADGTACTVGQSAGACHGGGCAAGCLVSGTIYATGAHDPNDACRVCDPSKDPTAFVAVTDGTACAGDGNDCTNDICLGGACSHPAVADGTKCTSDGNPCTGNVCRAGACTHPDLSKGTPCATTGQCDGSGTCNVRCRIGGTYYPAGATDPSNACETCDPTASKTAWTPTAGGTGCGTAQVCDGAGTCGSGCFVSGHYYADGTVDPNDPCQACDPKTSTSTWTQRADGSGCGTGKVCTGGSCRSGCDIGGTFYAAGTADPAHPLCAACKPATSTSGWTAIDEAKSCNAPSGFCHKGSCQPGCGIGGVFYQNGTVNPSNVCQVCNDSNGFAWTNKGNGTSCDDGNLCNGVYTCQSGTCTETTKPVSCTTPPVCHTTTGATCDTSTGACTYPTAPNGTSCLSGCNRFCSSGSCLTHCPPKTLCTGPCDQCLTPGQICP